EGLEQTFNDMLTGKHGEYKLTFDKDGRKTSDKLVTPPEPGYNVVTTLDLRVQQLAEKALEAKAKRGAIVIIEQNNGDILSLASWPTYDPNLFVPSISAEQLKALQDHPDIPLLPRAYRSSYPPGSTFKIAVGIAGLESAAVSPDGRFDCVPATQIGNVTFHNWKEGARGALNFVQALTQSCDTWFDQVGLDTGGAPLIRRVSTMLKSPEKPAPRNGDRKTKSARQHGSEDFYQPTSRNMRSPPFTKARSAAKCTAAPRLRR